MQEPEILKYKTGNGEIEIRLTEEGEAYLSQSAMARLFSRSVDAVSLHLRKLAESGTLDLSVVEESSVTGADGKRYKTKLYPLSAALEIGRRIRSEEGEKLKAFVESELSERERKSGESIIIYNNGGISLPVTVSPKEKTVWVDKEQLALLFDTTRQNLEYHIQNIYSEGELEEGATCKDFLQVQSEGDRMVTRTSKVYNLDMAISLGYRINSKKGIAFRRWATEILHQYLLTGYAINESRTLVTDENYINLIHHVNQMDHRLINLENARKVEWPKIFADGHFFDAKVYLKNLFARAKKSILLIDPYADINALTFLEDKGKEVEVHIVTSHKAKLSQGDVDSFNLQFGGARISHNDKFHDRYVVLDEAEIYHIGASLNRVGHSIFGIDRITEPEMIAFLMARVS